MKKIIVVLAILLLALTGYYFVQSREVVTPAAVSTTTIETPVAATQEEVRQVVMPGTYTVDTANSLVNWAGKKPLIEGYTNSGTIMMSAGSITVGEAEATGDFTIDMNTLKVGLTAKKPNQETKLEEHLKSDRWFDVTKNPTASYKITSVTKMPDSDTTFNYTINGELTMKGIMNEVSFPATIYQTADGTVVAKAATELDRTKWGITSGSGSFFDNLADNVIDDMIALSFTIEAKK